MCLRVRGLIASAKRQADVPVSMRKRWWPRAPRETRRLVARLRGHVGLAGVSMSRRLAISDLTIVDDPTLRWSLLAGVRIIGLEAQRAALADDASLGHLDPNARGLSSQITPLNPHCRILKSGRAPYRHGGNPYVAMRRNGDGRVTLPIAALRNCPLPPASPLGASNGSSKSWR
jgi:hypothetical protein